MAMASETANQSQQKFTITIIVTNNKMKKMKPPIHLMDWLNCNVLMLVLLNRLGTLLLVEK